MDEPMTRYTFSVNQKGADLLAWLCVETGLDRGEVLLRAMALMRAALETENRGLILQVFDPETEESVPVTGLRKGERPSPS